MSRELDELRTTCWRQRHEIESLTDSVEILRTGANALAIEIAVLRFENEHLHARARGTKSST